MEMTPDTIRLQKLFDADDRLIELDGYYDINHTIAPKRPFQAVLGPHFKLRCDPKGDYVSIPQGKRGSTEYHASGKYCAFDLSGCTRSQFIGDFDASSAHVPVTSIASRASVNDNLALFSATEKPCAELLFDNLTVSGFGYGLYQGDYFGPEPQRLYHAARMRVAGHALFNRCKSAFYFGRQSSGLDDSHFGTLRLNECWGQTEVHATDLIADSIFIHGLKQHNAMASVVQGGLNIAANVALMPGDTVVLCTEDGLQWVDTITDELRLTMPSRATGTLQMYLNPGSLVLNSAQLIAKHLFFEGNFNHSCAMLGRSTVNLMNLKVSPNFASHGDSTIQTCRLSGSIQATCSENWFSNKRGAKYAVSLGQLQSRAGTRPSIHVDLVCGQRHSQVGDLVSYAPVSIPFRYYRSSNSNPLDSSNVTVRYSDKTISPKGNSNASESDSLWPDEGAV